MIVRECDFEEVDVAEWLRRECLDPTDQVQSKQIPNTDSYL